MKLNVVDRDRGLAAARRGRAARVTQAAAAAVVVCGVESAAGHFVVAALAVDGELVVDAELALGHAAQVALHDDLAGHVCAQHLALRRHEQVDILQDVQEELIASVFDALATPADLTCHLVGDLSRLLFRLGLDALLRDVSLQNAYVRVLRVAKVKNLFKILLKLVNFRNHTLKLSLKN